MKIRVVSLLLALCVALSVLLTPALASAAGVEAAQIEKQIRDTYRAALRGSGRYSFNGYCASMVNWQTYLLGIDTYVVGADGKDEYDHYAALNTTTGGYKVKAYPAPQYTLLTALNEITANGTRDAYNILVGFQRTNTREGSIYGHALLIHAILDGTVYFAECFTASLDDKLWAEGDAIHCSIETFCDYYARWTTFEGVVSFGIKSYADVCAEYETGMYAMATQELTVYAEPWDAGVNEPEPTGKRLEKGKKLKVGSLWETPEGVYFYELPQGGYVLAEHMVYIGDCLEDVTLSNLRMPGTLRRGVGHCLQGMVTSRSGMIESLEVVVYDPNKGVEEPEFSGSIEVNAKAVSLAERKLDRQMLFRNLPTGSYNVLIRVQLKTHYLENGQLAERTAQVELWHSEVEIITDWGRYADVTFNANGGEADLDRLTVKQGQTLSQLPDATWGNHVFLGWSLDKYGKEPVAADMVIEDSVTLYAQWEEAVSGGDGWQCVSGKWSYAQKGTMPEGWFTSHGVQFYQKEGKLLCGWNTVDGVSRYFNQSGALCTGWKQIGRSRYFLKEDGSKTVGWYYENNGRYFFDVSGRQQTEWVFADGEWYYLFLHGQAATGEREIDGAFCLFQDNGILQLAQKVTESGSYYVVYDRSTELGDLTLRDTLLLG